MTNFIILPILLTIILSIGIRMITWKNDKTLSRAAILASVILSFTTLLVLYAFYEESLTLIYYSDTLHFHLRIDGLSVIFATLVSVLWPLATLYASKYMTHEGRMKRFFFYYTMTYGAVIGLSFSANMITTYLFFECLTFITLPLVIQKNVPRDVLAGKIYVKYSMLGASMGFIGMMLFLYHCNTLEFGVPMEVGENIYVLIAYLFMFVGFGVKAGLFPLHRWLIAAGVAPTPVTALLHAVAVVKSGVFVVMRVTYYLFDYEYLKGTWAQGVVLILCMISILFGSSMAMKNKHLKRRFAYSTVSQLSYILLAIATMSYTGLLAGVIHMVYHAIIKIVIFYTAGNVMFANHKEYVSEIEGYGKNMKFTFLLFTISSLALVGIPPLGGFISKFSIGKSVVDVGGYFGLIGIFVLMISALLTAMYLLQISILAFLPHNDSIIDENVKEAPKQMLISMSIITAIMLVLSVTSAPFVELISQTLKGGL